MINEIILTSIEKRLIAEVRQQLENESSKIATASEGDYRLTAHYRATNGQPWVILRAGDYTSNEERVELSDGSLLIKRW